MPEDETTAPDTSGGQSEPGSGGGQTTGADPAGSGAGQAAGATGQTSQGAPDTGSQEDSFFDPRSIADKPELQAAYKQMQRAYTKKMQNISEQKQKIEAYDAFYQDPISQVQRIAKQYGYSLTRAEAADVANSQQNQNNQQQNWQPQSWDDVMERATQIAEQRIMEKMNPVFSEVQNIRKQSIESQLSEIDPTWQQYEDQMKTNLGKHPTLATDPAMLYRLSVPQDVLESRATQAALKKLEAKGQSANVSGSSTTTRQPQGGLPDKPVSFQDAVAAAKKVLSEQGIRPA